MNSIRGWRFQVLATDEFSSRAGYKFVCRALNKDMHYGLLGYGNTEEESILDAISKARMKTEKFNKQQERAMSHLTNG